MRAKDVEDAKIRGSEREGTAFEEEFAIDYSKAKEGISDEGWDSLVAGLRASGLAMQDVQEFLGEKSWHTAMSGGIQASDIEKLTYPTRKEWLAEAVEIQEAMAEAGKEWSLTDITDWAQPDMRTAEQQALVDTMKEKDIAYPQRVKQEEERQQQLPQIQEEAARQERTIDLHTTASFDDQEKLGRKTKDFQKSNTRNGWKSKEAQVQRDWNTGNGIKLTLVPSHLKIDTKTSSIKDINLASRVVKCIEVSSVKQEQKLV